MAMGTRREQQEDLWIPSCALARSGGHPFYEGLNRVLAKHDFDGFVESRCRRFYAATMGRPSLAPGIYFRLLLVGYFEGIDSERGISWRTGDSLSIREFVGIPLQEGAPDHTTISRTRRLIDVETHRQVFRWILELLASAGLVKGKRMGIDATNLEANAALRSIVRRDDGQSYEEFLKELAQQSGIATPSREDLARVDRKRKKKGSNKEWVNPHDPDARITRMEGRLDAFGAQSGARRGHGHRSGDRSNGAGSGLRRYDDGERDVGGSWHDHGRVDRAGGADTAERGAASASGRHRGSRG